MTTELSVFDVIRDLMLLKKNIRVQLSAATRFTVININLNHLVLFNVLE